MKENNEQNDEQKCKVEEIQESLATKKSDDEVVTQKSSVVVYNFSSLASMAINSGTNTYSYVQEAVRAILRCLGFENEQQKSSSTSLDQETQPSSSSTTGSTVSETEAIAAATTTATDTTTTDGDQQEGEPTTADPAAAVSSTTDSDQPAYDDNLPSSSHQMEATETYSSRSILIRKPPKPSVGKGRPPQNN